MDLVWLRRRAGSLYYSSSTASFAKKVDEAFASVSEGRGALVNFLMKCLGSGVRESIYIYIYVSMRRLMR